MTQSLQAETDYHSLKDYASTAYTLLDEYTTTNTSCTEKEVQYYLTSPALSIVFKDAQEMGYERILVIRGCYHIAIEEDPRNDKILAALRNELKLHRTLKNIAFWGGLGFSVFSTICVFPLLYMTVKMYREYLRS